MTTATASFELPRRLDLAKPAIQVDGLRKSYRNRSVLDAVSFDVRIGEVFGILGPNGAGKTTTVEIVQGLRPRDGGLVRVLGYDPGRNRARLRGLIGSQLQSSALPDRLRVGEALRLFTRLAGGVVDRHQLAEEWGLARLSRTAFGSLSGGERQRLFVALALVNRPQVVFLDELTQGLDPAARRDTWALIARLRDRGAAVVLVTHDMAEAEHLCDRVAVLHAGQVRACDTPAALVTQIGGLVRTRFTSRDGATVAGLEGVPGVHEVRHDGERAEVVGDVRSPVLVAAELARRGTVPPDFTVVRPSLHDVFLRLTAGGVR
jgi:ABC-2 type transport system ATP-binding protein